METPYTFQKDCYFKEKKKKRPGHMCVQFSTLEVHRLVY